MIRSKNWVILIFICMFIFLCGCSGYKINEPYIYDGSKYSVGNKAFHDEVNSIHIDWIAGNVFIQKSTNHELIIREEVDIEIEEQYKMHYCYEDNHLNIKFAGSNNILNYKYKIKNLYVFLPYEINNIIINNVSADIEIKNVNISNLELDNISGYINIEDSKISNLDIDSVSGEIILFDNNIMNLDISSVSGDIGMSFINMPNEMEISTTSANATMYITQNDSIGIEFDTISGEFKSNLTYYEEGDYFIFNDLNTKYEIETVSGGLIINKK